MSDIVLGTRKELYDLVKNRTYLQPEDNTELQAYDINLQTCNIHDVVRIKNQYVAWKVINFWLIHERIKRDKATYLRNLWKKEYAPDTVRKMTKRSVEKPIVVKVEEDEAALFNPDLLYMKQQTIIEDLHSKRLTMASQLETFQNQQHELNLKMEQLTKDMAATDLKLEHYQTYVEQTFAEPVEQTAGGGVHQGELSDYEEELEENQRLSVQEQIQKFESKQSV